MHRKQLRWWDKYIVGTSFQRLRLTSADIRIVFSGVGAKTLQYLIRYSDIKKYAKKTHSFNGCRSFFRYFLLKADAFSVTMEPCILRRNLLRQSSFTTGFIANDSCVMRTYTTLWNILGKVPELGEPLQYGM